MKTVALNKAVPDFELPATGDKQIRLSDLKGKTVVVYFYPKDNTPGCTLEGQDFSDQYAKLKRRNTVVLGVSRDSVKSHENFKAKYQLPFELVSDPDEIACSAYGVIKDKTMYGKPVRGIERSTFLIGPDGRILHLWRGVKVDGHAQEVLAALQKALA